MTRRQVHILQITHIPSVYYYPSAVWVVLYRFLCLGYLVDSLAVVSAPAAPLIAVYMPKVSVGVCPFVPDTYSIVLQVSNISVSFQKPK